MNTKLNAYREVIADHALAQARKAESGILAGRYLGPLHGIPIAVKDVTCSIRRALRQWEAAKFSNTIYPRTMPPW
ncbi:MAG: hypothetical protein HYX27_28305 [Acidobacteria bacterium]|nr:hypothetical protein [Acidobacteriota bacterium]